MTSVPAGVDRTQVLGGSRGYTGSAWQGRRPSINGSASEFVPWVGFKKQSLHDS